MSVNFSTITPMSQSTISKAPAFTVAQQPQPAASSPMGPQYGPAPKKKSHWFAKTLAAIVVLAGGAAILRGKVGAFKNFDKTKPLEEGAKFKEQATYYGKKAVAVVGDFINEKIVAPVLKLFKGKPKEGAQGVEGAAGGAQGAAGAAEGAAGAADGAAGAAGGAA